MTIERRTDPLPAPVPGPGPATETPQAPGPGTEARQQTPAPTTSPSGPAASVGPIIPDAGPQAQTFEARVAGPRPPVPVPGPEAYVIPGPGPQARPGLGPEASPGPGPQAPNAPGPGPEAAGPKVKTWARRAQAWASSGTDGPGPQAPDAGPQAPGPKGRPVIREPRWLKITILLGLYGLTIAGLVLASSGQVEAAEVAGVDDGRQYLAPFVLELNALLWTLMGYRRGRRGNSPYTFWAIAAASGVFSIYLVTRHAPTQGASLLFGGASAAAQLLTFVHLKEDLERFLINELEQRGGSRAKYGLLWLTHRSLAWRAWLIDVEHSVGVRADAISYAQVWMVVHDDTLAALTKDLKWRNLRARARARSLAERTARNEVARACGAPVSDLPMGGVRVPEIRGLIRGVAGPEAPSLTAGPVPSPEPGPQAPQYEIGASPEVGPQAQDPRSQASGPGPEARDRQARGPRPPKIKAQPAAVPVSPAPAGPRPEPRTRTLGPAPTDPRRIDVLLQRVAQDPPSLEGNVQDLTFYREDLINLAERTASDWHGGDWLDREACPTKVEVSEICSRGSTHAGNIRRVVDAIRKVNAAEMSQQN